MRKRWQSWTAAAAVLAAATVAALLLRPFLAPVNLAMIYLLGVVAISARSDRLISLTAAAASVASFDFFCVPPYLTMAVGDPEYGVTFVGMFAVALAISSLTLRVRRQTEQAEAREAKAQALYRLSERLSTENTATGVATVAGEVAGEILAVRVAILPAVEGRISFRTGGDTHPWLPDSDQMIAQWVLHHGRKAGLGIDQYPRAAAQYVPLRGAHGTAGVMALSPPDGAGPQPHEREIMVDLLASQTALVLERIASQQASEAARAQVQTEQMRSSLLSVVSHDFRTPLASITGAASMLRQQGTRLPEETRTDLLDTIAEEAERLSRLVANLLDLTRFHSGPVTLRRDACPLEEIVGTALRRLETRLGPRHVTVDLPPNLPMVAVDEVLIGQVLFNLLENADKYSPAGSPLVISAQTSGSFVETEIRDFGPGFAEEEKDRLFEKFYRGRAAGRHGAGLGLAIARAVVEAHGGSIEAGNHPDGGAVFRFSLPVAAVIPLEIE